MSHPTFSRTQHRQHGGIKGNLLAVVLAVAGTIMLALTLFPPTYSTDLSLIGQGKPAITLVYDWEDDASLRLMESFHAIEDEFSDVIHFLVADIRSPQGEMFADSRRVPPGSIIYYNAQGQRVHFVDGYQLPEQLRASFKTAFNL